MTINMPGKSEPANPSIEVVHSAESGKENLSNANSSRGVATGGIVAANGLPEDAPEPIIPPGSAVQVDHLQTPDWTPPFYVQYRLLTCFALTLTVFWLVAALYILFTSISLNDFSALLLHEVGLLGAGILTPVALLWIVVSYFERGKLYEQETHALRWHLKQLTFPSDAAGSRAAQLTEILRSQANYLTRASEEASERAQDATNLIRTQTAVLITASKKASQNFGGAF